MAESNCSAIGKLGIIMVGAADVSRSVAFYRDRLGLRVLQQNEGMAFLDAGGVTLVLSAEMRKTQNQLAETIELVFNVADVNATYQELNTRGVEFFREPRPITADSQWVANFRDPDGHLLSLFGPGGTGRGL